MALPTQMTAVYTARADGTTVAALAAAMDKSIVPLDPDLLIMLGMSVVSDIVTSGVATVTRTIILSLIQPPFVVPFNGNPLRTVPYPATLGIRSKSANDSATGTGARTVTVNFIDIASAPQTEAVVLNGTTRVPLLKAIYAQINSGITGPLFGIVINTAGADTSNDGDLVIDWLDTEGRSNVIGYAPASIFAKTLPNGSAPNPRMLGNWMQKRLEGTLGLPVVSQLPVVFA